MRKLLLIPLSLTLTACMMKSDIVATGPDSYMMSAVACPACGGTTKSMEMAYRKAGNYCRDRGKRLLKTGMTNDRWFNEAGETVLEFRCLEEDHPAFVRADERRDSDIIVEQR